MLRVRCMVLGCHSYMADLEGEDVGKSVVSDGYESSQKSLPDTEDVGLTYL